MLSREEVIWCYQMMLGRRPESERVIKEQMEYDDITALRRAVFFSPEFQSQLTWLGIHPTQFTKKGEPVVQLPLNDVELDISSDQLNQLWTRLQMTWETLGSEEPHFSVLSLPQYCSEEIEQNLDQFWSSGESEASRIERIMNRYSFQSSSTRICSEFGCGIGRITIPLAKLFCRVHAFDISKTHIARAEKEVSERELKNIEFHLVTRDNLGSLPPADLVYCRLVLQHNPPPIIELLIRHLLRSVTKGGLAVIQVPTYIVGYRFRLDEYLKAISDGIEMHCLPQFRIFRATYESGCQVLEVREDQDAGRPDVITSNTFVIGRDYP